MENNILNQLNRSVNAKNECAKNIRTAFKISKPLGHAYEWYKYIDNTQAKIGSVAVMLKDSPGLNEEGKKYGHVAVITEIDEKAKKVRLFDGPNAFHFWTEMKNIYGYITPQKMIKLGSNIKITMETTTTIGYYEEIFKREYINSSVFKDLTTAKGQFGDIAYFIAIGLERINKNK